ASTGFDNCAETSSNYRRIQRFISSVNLQIQWISRLTFALIPAQKSYVLVMDRTNWKFGKQDINILMLGISYKNMCFPILFKMLDKRG
ncbi:IS4 family transposase, partial [Myroides pelagicus]|nr:IS4 family transposase [Myroides pelagicus]